MNISGKEIVNRIDIRLKEMGTNRNALLIDLNMPTSTIATWKMRNITPRADDLYKIAKYIQISMETLLTGETPEVIHYSPAATEAAEIVDRLSVDGQKAALASLKGMELSYPLGPQNTVGLPAG